MSRGHQRERDLTRYLKKDKGGWALRSPASKGTVDVVHIVKRELVISEPCTITVPGVDFYEVKSTSAGPFHSFGPSEREALRLEASQVAATPWECWWPPDGKGPRFLAEDEWPTPRP